MLSKPTFCSTLTEAGFPLPGLGGSASHLWDTGDEGLAKDIFCVHTHVPRMADRPATARGAWRSLGHVRIEQPSDLTVNQAPLHAAHHHLHKPHLLLSSGLKAAPPRPRRPAPASLLALPAKLESCAISSHKYDAFLTDLMCLLRVETWPVFGLVFALAKTIQQ